MRNPLAQFGAESEAHHEGGHLQAPNCLKAGEIFCRSPDRALVPLQDEVDPAVNEDDRVELETARAKDERTPGTPRARSALQRRSATR